MICRNKSESNYIRLKNAVGEKTADNVIDNNNGYYLEFDRDGVESRLYQELLSITGNNIVALKVKAKYMSSSFREKHKTFIEKYKDDEDGIPAYVLMNYLEENDELKVVKWLNKGKNSFNKLLGKSKINRLLTEFDQQSFSNQTRLIKYMDSKIAYLEKRWNKNDSDKNTLKELKDLRKDYDDQTKAISTTQYRKSMYKMAELLINDTNVFINTFDDILNNNSPITDPTYVTKTFNILNATHDFMLEQLLELELRNPTPEAVEAKEKLTRSILDAKKRFQEIRDQIIIHNQKEKIAEMGLDQSLLDTVIVNKGNKEELAPISRSQKAFSKIKIAFKNMFQDLTQSTNPIVQITAQHAMSIDNKFSTLMQLKIAKIKEVVDNLVASVGSDNTFLRFFDWEYNEKGEKVYKNKLISKFDNNHYKKWRKNEFHNLIHFIEIEEGVKIYHLENTEGKFSEKILSDANRAHIEEQLKKHDLDTKYKFQGRKPNLKLVKIQAGKDDVDISDSEYTKRRLNELKFIADNYDIQDPSDPNNDDAYKNQLKWQEQLDELIELKNNATTMVKKGEIENQIADLKLKEPQKAYNVITSYINNPNLNNTDLIYLNKLTEKRINLFYLLKSTQKDKLKTDAWKAFESEYNSNPAIKEFYDLYLEVAKDNYNKMKVHDLSKSAKVNEYDIYESPLTIDELMEADGGFLSHVMNNMKDSILSFNMKNADEHAFQDYDFATNSVVNKVRNPVRYGKSFNESSKNLGNVLAYHTAASHLFAAKQEIEPEINLLKSYLSALKVDEDGQILTVKADEELKNVESFANQYLYSTDSNPKEESGDLYIDTFVKEDGQVVNQVEKYNALREEYNQIRAIIDDHIEQKKVIPDSLMDVKNRIVADIKKIEKTAITHSNEQVVTSINNLARLSAIGMKPGAALVDSIVGIFSNIAEATVGKHFNMKQYIEGFSLAMGYLFGVNKDKIDMLMKLNHVNYQNNEAAIMNSTDPLASKNSNIINDLKALGTPKETIAGFKVQNLAYMFYKYSGILNNIPVMISMLKNQQIKTSDKDTQMSIWDSYDKDGKFIHDPLFDPYLQSVPNNKGGYTTELTQYGSNLSIKINHIIDITHGNYADKKPTRINTYWYGKLLMVFKRWIPNMIDNLVGEERLDTIQGGSKKGQLWATTDMLKNNNILTSLKVIGLAPLLGAVSPSSLANIKLEEVNELNKDQIVRLMTKLQLTLFMVVLYGILSASIDDDDEVYYEYDEEFNTYKQKRRQKKEYNASVRNYLFNLVGRLSNDANPFSSVTGLSVGNLVPVTNYMSKWVDLLTTQATLLDSDRELHYDDIIRHGAFEGQYKKVIDFLKVMPITAGPISEIEMATNSRKYTHK